MKPSFLRRLLSTLGIARGFDAAGGGRSWANAKTLHNLNTAILAGANPAAHRTAHAVRNNPWAASAITAVVSALVGTGLKPRPQHPDPEVRTFLARAWEQWTDHADAAGLTDFYGLQALAVRAMVEAGEAFAHLRNDGAHFQVALIDREQVLFEHFSDLRHPPAWASRPPAPASTSCVCCATVPAVQATASHFHSIALIKEAQRGESATRRSYCLLASTTLTASSDF